MIIRCWGARGSIPVSGEEYLRYLIDGRDYRLGSLFAPLRRAEWASRCCHSRDISSSPGISGSGSEDSAAELTLSAQDASESAAARASNVHQRDVSAGERKG